jgi:hypothetical protein
MTRTSGWRAIAYWSVAIGSVTFSVASMMSIGLFVAPLALLLCWLAAWRAHAWPEAAVGTLMGAGGVCLVIAYLHRSYVPCPDGPVRLRPGQHFSCGGFDASPWLAVGAVLLAAGVSSYVLFRRRSADVGGVAPKPGAA